MEEIPGREERSVASPQPASLSSLTLRAAQPQRAELLAKQPSSPKTYPFRWDLMILLLAIVGGAVDAIVLTAFDALPGPQTGNTVLLGSALAHGQFLLATTITASPFGFLLGAAIAQLILIKHRGSWPWPSAVGTIQIVELLFLGISFVGWSRVGTHPADLAKGIFVAMAAFAMGIQSVALLDLPAAKPTTTYITGMLTTFTMELIKFLKLSKSAPVSKPSQEITPFLSFAGPWIYGLTWTTYFLGVVAGALVFNVAGSNALLLPVVLLAVVILLGRNSEQAFVISDKETGELPERVPPCS